MIVGEEVDAAVADVRDGDAVVADEHADDRGAHAAVVVAAFRGAEDAAVRGVHRGPQAIAVKRERLVETVRPREVGVVGRSMNEALQCFDGEPRRDFTGTVSAHPVCHSKETKFRVGDELVLIRFPDPACIRYATGPYHERISRRIDWQRKRIIGAYKSLEKENNTTLVAPSGSAIPDRAFMAATPWLLPLFIGVQRR